ncbi:MAG TPA: hypothetical protein VIK29_04720, partial [Paludibacter sp.]
YVSFMYLCTLNGKWMHNVPFTTTIKKNTPLSNLGNPFFFDRYSPFSYCSFTNRWLSPKRHHLF